eukprot:GDKJ01020671.1.p1 GENE.GDKJ01020671.1~~GDKJ01020671.1.p1  ORF type:complete len:110 (+),score=2.38 GDKJ01020671.1:49-330(+)
MSQQFDEGTLPDHNEVSFADDHQIEEHPQVPSLWSICHTLDVPHIHHRPHRRSTSSTTMPNLGTHGPSATVIFMHHVACQTDDAEIIDATPSL